MANAHWRLLGNFIAHIKSSDFRVDHLHAIAHVSNFNVRKGVTEVLFSSGWVRFMADAMAVNSSNFAMENMRVWLIAELT